jgi:ribulose-bisphosphate carboxylase small chain
MWGLPMFDLHDAAGIMDEIGACRAEHPQEYVRVNAFDSTLGVESVALSFIVDRPSEEPGFKLVRTEGPGRSVRYATVSYAVERGAEGDRYHADSRTG